jgi:hypothetical protein
MSLVIWQEWFLPKEIKKLIGLFSTTPLENQVKGVVPNV